MDGLVEELLRLESAKHEALIQIDATAYDENVRQQLRVLAESKQSLSYVTSVERLLALSQLITLNTRLLNNLVASSPLFASLTNGYTAAGRMSSRTATGHMSVEA